MLIAEMYMRVVPKTMPQVGQTKAVPTGPTEAVTGTITAVDPEGVILLKLPSSLMLVGYCAKQKPGIDVSRLSWYGIAANPDDELWIFNRVEG